MWSGNSQLRWSAFPSDWRMTRMPIACSAGSPDDRRLSMGWTFALDVRNGKVTESWFFNWNAYQQDELFPL